MAKFNKLMSSHICTECKVIGDFDVQFEYGDLDSHRYCIRDTVKWGYKNKGDASYGRVIVDGFGFCPSCKAVLGFVVGISNNIIMNVDLAEPEGETFEESGYTILEGV